MNANINPPLTGEHRAIPLTNGGFTFVDATDFEDMMAHKWHKRANGNRSYAYQTIKRPISIHFMIMGPAVDEVVCHLNGNGLDNRRCNLVVTSRKNAIRNQQTQTSNTSGLKGVSRTKRGKWAAKIRTDIGRIWLGTFDTPEEAHAAYCAAGEKHHGPFFRAA
jgi:hypothetical protein